MARPQSAGVLLIFAALVGLPLATSQERPQKQDYNSGEYLYRTHCASCHGQTGRGDGPAASTFQKPLSDLATLSSRAGGQFPRAEVTRIVDGRQKTQGHKPGSMPEWGRILQLLEGDDRVAQQRIETVVTYLESIQRKNDE
jgi:mono/diheme cytochrome c family protein